MAPIRAALAVASAAALVLAAPAFGTDDELAREARGHFEARCKAESGEKVYETHPHVTSVLVLKGDEQVASTLIGTVQFGAGRSQKGFDFVEILAGDDFLRITPAKDHPRLAKRRMSWHASRFAVAWEDISTPEDRKYRVAASRLRIIDLLTENLVAERIAFAWRTERQPKTTCPAIADGTYEDRGFVLSVLKPEDD